MERRKVSVPDPQTIAETLSSLRQQSLAAAGQALPPMRAMVVNLVAHADRRAAAEEMANQVAAVAEQHPSRAIVVASEPAAGPQGLDIYVWAHCHAAAVERLVCFEGVEILARGPAVERLPAIVASLLLRDLPVVLWWPGDLPVGTPLFEHLLASTDRLVVDSAAARDPGELLQRLVALGQPERCPCTVSDLNWQRLTTWRELTAQLFDPPDCRAYLARLSRVRLELAGGAGQPGDAQALLLVGWLATRLAWRPAPAPWRRTPAGDALVLRRDGEPVTVERVWLPGGGAGLHALTLAAGEDGGQATFILRRSPPGDQAEVAIRLPGAPSRQRTVPLPEPKPGELLAAELASLARDPTYSDALRLAAQLSAQRPPKAPGAG